jgi:hypothetical protein
MIAECDGTTLRKFRGGDNRANSISCPVMPGDASINEKAGTSPAATEEKRGHHRQRNR